MLVDLGLLMAMGVGPGDLPPVGAYLSIQALIANLFLKIIELFTFHAE
jgi:hypothetical protein